MKIRDQAAWDEAIRVNGTSGYAGGILDYAYRWANLMEREIEAGKALADIAKDSSRAADTDGITGFMYGCAVGLLAQTWEHGEELRRWHNLDTQIGTEGERANATGGVLNPALLVVGKPE